MRLVIRVDLRIVAPTRYCYVNEALVYEFFSGLLCIHVDEHAVGSLPLAAVARDRIAVVEVRILFDVECNSAARVEADSQIAARVEFLDCAKLAVGDVLLSIRRGELYAVALREAALCLAVDRHALQTARIVADFLPAVALDRE